MLDLLGQPQLHLEDAFLPTDAIALPSLWLARLANSHALSTLVVRLSLGVIPLHVDVPRLHLDLLSSGKHLLLELHRVLHIRFLAGTDEDDGTQDAIHEIEHVFGA